MCNLSDAIDVTRGCVCALFTLLLWCLGTLFTHFCAFCFCCSDGPGLFDFTQVSYFPPTEVTQREQCPSDSQAPRLPPDTCGLICLPFAVPTLTVPFSP